MFNINRMLNILPKNFNRKLQFFSSEIYKFCDNYSKICGFKTKKTNIHDGILYKILSTQIDYSKEHEDENQ